MHERLYQETVSVSITVLRMVLSLLMLPHVLPSMHYSILENNSLSGVICWGSGGDFFVIKDVNDFTVNLLPRIFKHSNFTSFVRQLNKYDFRKVRSV